MPDVGLARRWMKLAVKNPAEAVDRLMIKTQGLRHSPSESGKQTSIASNGFLGSLRHIGWEEKLHRHLGWPWPCAQAERFPPV